MTAIMNLLMQIITVHIRKGLILPMVTDSNGGNGRFTAVTLLHLVVASVHHLIILLLNQDGIAVRNIKTL